MNYLQLVQRLKRESARSGGPPAGIGVLSGDDINLGNWIADAWREVQRKRMDWAWMRKTIAGPLSLGVLAYPATTIDALATNLASWQDPSDDYTVRAYAVAGKPINLTWLPYERFQALFLVETRPNGSPLYWSVAPNKSLLIGPAPDTAGYTVSADYRAKPTELVADADTPDMPEQFHMLLVWRGLLEVAGFDAAPEVEARARRNMRVAWSDLLDDQAPRIQLTSEPLA